MGASRSRSRARSRPRCASARERVARSRSSRPSRRSSSTTDGDVAGVHHEEQTESHALIEQLMILANEQVAGYLADAQAADALPRARAARPAVGRVARRAARERSTCRRRRCPKQMTPQQAADAVGEISRAWWRATCATGHGRALPVARAALAQAGLLLAAEPRPRRARRARATATSPRRSAATRTSSCTARCSRRSASTTSRRARTSWTRRALTARRAEREAMKIERDADDVCLAFLLERRLPDAGPASRRASRARSSG